MAEMATFGQTAELFGLNGGLNPFQRGQQNQIALQQQQQQIQQQELQRQRALEMQNDLTNFAMGSQDPKELIGIMTKYPEYAKTLQQPYEALKEEDKQGQAKQLGELYAVINNGKPEQVKSYFDNKIQSAIRNKDEQAVALYRSIQDLYDLNPNIVKSQAITNLGAIIGFDKLANFVEANKTPEQRAYETGLIERAKTEANPYQIALTTANIQKAQNEANKIQNEISRIYNGKIPIEKIPEYEQKLRNELSPLLKKNREAYQAYQQMQSIFSNTGAVPGIQDVAAVVSFFKSIDPNSTVTTTETGQIQGATGLEGKIASLWNKAISAGNFTKEAREQLQKTAGDIYKPLEKEADKIKQKYKNISDKYGIDFNNVDVLDFDTVGQQPTQRPDINAPIDDIINFYKKKSVKDAVKQVESGGDPNAVSPKGAVGTMQTMPATLKDPGFGVKPAKDNSSAELERVGSDYLQAMQKRYGNLNYALIAYNWGPGNADRWIKNGADFSKLPKETQDYVKKVNKLLVG